MQKEYKTWRDCEGMVIYLEFYKKLKIDHTTKCFLLGYG